MSVGNCLGEGNPEESRQESNVYWGKRKVAPKRASGTPEIWESHQEKMTLQSQEGRVLLRGQCGLYRDCMSYLAAVRFKCFFPTHFPWVMINCEAYYLRRSKKC